MNAGRVVATGLVMVAMASPVAIEAQDHGLSIEVRGGWNFPMGEFSDAGAESEVSFGGDLIVNLSPAVSVYGGWGRDQFNCDGCGGSDDIHASGPEAGVKFLFTRQDGGVLPWARVGGTYHKLAGELSGADFESDRHFGVQASVGVDIPLGDVLSIAPALRFQNTTVDFDGPLGLFRTEQTTRYFSLDLGAHFHIP